MFKVLAASFLCATTASAHVSNASDITHGLEHVLLALVILPVLAWFFLPVVRRQLAKVRIKK